jgi:glycosyltransferase involved in cell wall biosynthesis
LKAEEAAELRGIPHPRLTYLGVPQNRFHDALVKEVLSARPDWHFVHPGPWGDGKISNAHSLPWISQEALPGILSGTDVGFMPYDCRRDREYHCAPLKLFDYFAAGLPVVSTPIVFLWELQDLVYLGDTSAEIIAAVENALAEPPDSPKRDKRKEFARKHGLDKIAELLRQILPLDE